MKERRFKSSSCCLAAATGDEERIVEVSELSSESVMGRLREAEEEIENLRNKFVCTAEAREGEKEKDKAEGRRSEVEEKHEHDGEENEVKTKEEASEG